MDELEGGKRVKSNFLSVWKVVAVDDDGIIFWRVARGEDFSACQLPEHGPGNNNGKWNGQNGYMSENWPEP